MLRTRLLLLVLVLIGIGCKEFPSSEPAKPKLALSQLSGTWSASVKVVQKGSCSYNPSTSNLISNWIVDDAGNVTIEERSVAGQVSPQRTWKGTIDQELRISVQSNQRATCFSTPRTYTIELKGQILKKDGRYELSSLVDNPICPPNCLFDLDYFLQKDQ